MLNWYFEFDNICILACTIELEDKNEANNVIWLDYFLAIFTTQNHAKGEKLTNTWADLKNMEILVIGSGSSCMD